MLSVQLDRRTNVGNLKKLLCQRLDLHTNLFKMYRVFSNNQVTYTEDLIVLIFQWSLLTSTRLVYDCGMLLFWQEVECGNTDTLTTVSDNTRMTVKLSRVLSKGEYNIKVHELFLHAATPNEVSCTQVSIKIDPLFMYLHSKAN